MGAYETTIDILAGELSRVEAAFRGLTEQEWAASTLLVPVDPDLPYWTVFDLAGHFDISIGLTRMLIDGRGDLQPARDRTSFFINPRAETGPVVYQYAYTLVQGKTPADMPGVLAETFGKTIEECRAVPADTVGPGYCAPMRVDEFAVPSDAVAQAAGAYLARSVTARLGGWPLHVLSGGRLLRRAYPPGADPGICDSLIPQQGPNYALAKRLQRWRATLARDDGAAVSLNVAPPTRTRSVLKNRVLAAAYAGATRFGVEVFEPATCQTLMAALLVYDLHTGGGPARAQPWQDEAHAAAHGGLWRAAYAPRSALGLAALLGYPASRGVKTA